MRGKIFWTLTFLNLIVTAPATLASPCADRLVTTGQRVYYDHRIRKQVMEFLKRQIQFLDTLTLEPEKKYPHTSVLSDPENFSRRRTIAENIMAILERTERIESDHITVNLDSLKDIRIYLEEQYPSALVRRPIRGNSRTRRRIRELVSFIRDHHLLGQSQSNQSDQNSLTLLDIGAGSGRIAAGVAQELGIRLRDTFALELARYPNSRRDIKWISYGDDGRIPLSSESIDLAVTMMVFHHAPDASLLIQEVHRVLKPGGTWIVRETDAGDQPVLNLDSLEMISLNQILDNMLYVVFDPNSGVPMINNYRPIKWWKGLLELHGLKVEIFPTKEVGSPFNPVYLVVKKGKEDV